MYKHLARVNPRRIGNSDKSSTLLNQSGILISVRKANHCKTDQHTALARVHRILESSSLIAFYIQLLAFWVCYQQQQSYIAITTSAT